MRLKGILAGMLALSIFALQLGIPLPVLADEAGDMTEEITVDLTGQGEGYSAVLYNIENGLPTSEANAITGTPEGFIWIGGYSGLLRYDGNSFERIDSVSTGITSVVSLYVDSKERLWIGTNDNGIVKMEKGTYTQYNRTGGMKSSSIRSVTEAPDGTIYIATTHGMGTYTDDNGVEVVYESQIYDEYIRELRTGTDGVVYGITQNGAIFTFEDNRLTGFYDSSRLNLSGEGIKSILPDPDKPGNLYIGTSTGKIVYGNLKDGMKNPEIINVSPLQTVNSIEKVGDSIWVCADTGIGLYENGEFSKVENVPMNNSIDEMYVDYEGNVWFTSSRQGVMKIVANRFTDLFERYGLERTVVNSTCAYNEYLLMGTDTGLLALMKGGRVESIPVTSIEGLPEGFGEKASKQEEKGSEEEKQEGVEDASEAEKTPVEDAAEEGAEDDPMIPYDGPAYDNLLDLLKGCRIRSMMKDSKNRVWFSTYSSLGAVVYDNGKVKCYSTADGLPSNRVRVTFERSDGVILAACTGGLAFLSDSGVDDVYDEQSGLNNPEILTIAEAENGDILLGSDGDGIYVLTEHDVKNIGLDEGLTSEVVLRIKKDVKRGMFWIITSNSIGYMKEDYKVTTIDQFPYSNNFDLVENSRDEIWILSSNGIHVVHVDDLLANGEIKPVYFNRDSGLPCVTTANSYSCVDSNGNLYLSGTTGVAKVNIEEPFGNVGEIKAAVPYIDADTTRIYPDANGKFQIPAGVNKVTIYGYVFNYSLMNPQITYELKGFDKHETTVSRSDFEPIVYTNLKGGKYKFVMTLTDTMVNGASMVSVDIEKEKSIFEKLWFKALVVITVIALATGVALIIVRKRMDALLARHEKDKMFIREMIEAFAKTIDMKDKYTNGHSTRVAEYTVMLAKELGYDEETVEKYYNIALLHDIGKISIRPEVLNKNGKLTDEEFAEIKSHSAKGYNVLKDISIMPELAIGAGAHHERPDGKGYPKGLKGDEIPRVAQIIAVADTFDAMYSDRPYRKRMNFDKAVSIIKEVSGTQLQADVVDAFLRLVDKGEFRAPDDIGGGSTEDINNIHKKQDEAEAFKKQEEEKKTAAEAKAEEEPKPAEEPKPEEKNE